MIDKKFLYAVVGVSRDKSKYGFKVFKDLLDKGYKVVGINPRAEKILKQKIYPDLLSVDKKIDVVVMVVPPNLAFKLLHQVKFLKIDKVWFQPGSESAQAIDFCVENNIKYTQNACIMLDRKS